MSAKEILAELKKVGSEKTKKMWLSSGADDSTLGVKVEDMKKIQKRIKMDYELARELYDTGISDVMYFAGLIADDARMTKKDLQGWVEKANWRMVSEYTVPWVASNGPHGRELALKWIDSKNEKIASSGWGTYGSLVAITDDADLDLGEIKKLLQRIEKTIHEQPNRVRYVMNGFVIAVAAYVKPLNEFAKKIAQKIGVVSVDVGDTACTVPFAPEYIKKIEARGTIGKKRKSPKC